MKTTIRKARSLLKRCSSSILILLILLLAACGQIAQPNPSDPESNTPSKPTGLTATAGNAQVILNWEANSEATLSHYNIYQGTARGDLVKVDEVLKGSESYVASNLPNGLIHHFSIDAQLSTGERSERTEEVSATPQATASSICLFDSTNLGFNSCTFGN